MSRARLGEPADLPWSPRSAARSIALRLSHRDRLVARARRNFPERRGGESPGDASARTRRSFDHAPGIERAGYPAALGLGSAALARDELRLRSLGELDAGRSGR